MGEMEELLARVEKATGPDRELDEAIALALCDEHRFMQLADAPAGAGCEMYRFGTHGFHSALRVTASLDAALALVERALPGWHWMIGSHDYLDPSGGSFARVYPGPGRMSEGSGDHYGFTPALAVVAALLRALIKEKTSG